MGVGLTFGKTEQCMRAIGIETSQMELGVRFILMGASTQVIGRTPCRKVEVD